VDYRQRRDAESGLDNFGARYYASTTGRFMSPDPVFATVDRLADPQQWNMYSYVRNNPLSLNDLTGLDFHLTCDKNSDSTCVGGLQGQTIGGKFLADLVNFALHQVDAIHDLANHQSSKEPKLP